MSSLSNPAPPHTAITFGLSCDYISAKPPVLLLAIVLVRTLSLQLMDSTHAVMHCTVR